MKNAEAKLKHRGGCYGELVVSLEEQRRTIKTEPAFKYRVVECHCLGCGSVINLDWLRFSYPGRLIELERDGKVTTYEE